jgi:hypothetical protein
MDWATFQASLEDRLPGNPAVHDEKAIDKCVEEMTSGICSQVSTVYRPKASVTC